MRWHKIKTILAPLNPVKCEVCVHAGFDCLVETNLSHAEFPILYSFSLMIVYEQEIKVLHIK